MKRIFGACLFIALAAMVYAGIDYDGSESGAAAMVLPAANGMQEEEAGPDPGMCLFCHAAAVEQWMLSKHYKNEVDCVACHGASEDHIRVEDNTIKPEIYFSEGGARDIEFCREACHTELPADPHDTHIEDCCSCHLAHDFPSFSEEYFQKPGASEK